MPKRPSLPNLTSQYLSTTQINDAFRAIEGAFDNTVSRDGSTPNSMGADLDMDSNDILNVGTINAREYLLNNNSLVTTGITSFTFASRSSAEATTVPAAVNAIEVLHAGRVFIYSRDTSGLTSLAAITTNGGTVYWKPNPNGSFYDPAAWGDGWTALLK